jgi:hypothetical protein
MLLLLQRVLMLAVASLTLASAGLYSLTATSHRAGIDILEGFASMGDL